MRNNPLIELQKFGQSVWLDNISRALITSGELKRMIEEDGLRGVTSNPTIFEKAVNGSRDYDEEMRALVSQGKGTSEILDTVMIRDIQMAADLLYPVCEKTEGLDGFVSIEVNPALAHKTEETIKEARRLSLLVNKKNVMVKVPATPEGIPAIEQLTGEGVSINATLMFSIECYEQVAQAYIAGLEKLIRNNLSPGPVRSVASLFVSRIDTLVDQRLEERIRNAKNPDEERIAKALRGRVAIANAKLIYQKFKEIFNDPRFLRLKEKGAPVQRPLWGSTGTKNPSYSDVLYMEELIGNNTVNTVPQATLMAFKDHGRVRASLEEDLEGARETLRRLARIGIDLRRITEELQEQGVRLFADSFNALTASIAAKQEAIRV